MARRGENIRKRKDGRWEGRYIKARTSEGKIQWGYVYGTVYAEVKRALIQKKAEAGFYNLKRTDLTFEALAEVWLHSLRNSIKESTYAHYSYTLHKYLLPVLSKMPVVSFEESFLEQAMQQITTPIDSVYKPLGNSSARECLSMLRRICRYAAHLHIIRPMELEVALPKAIDKISAPLSPSRAATALPICAGESHASHNRLIIRVGIGSAYWRDPRLAMGRFRPETWNTEDQPDGLPNFLRKRAYKGGHPNA